jgi:hypothetical protein
MSRSGRTSHGHVTRRTILASGALILAGTRPGGVQAAPRRPPKAKYYFKIIEVNVGDHGDSSVASMARELLEKELSSRPEFTSDLGGATSDEDELAELTRRRLLGFRVSLRLDELTRNLVAPRPGGRLKQLAVQVKLSVFGTTFPGEKLAFGGDGEALLEAEVVESRLEKEEVPLVRDAMAQALKQAVDQTVAKLSLPVAAPLNESKRKKKH